MTDLRKAAEMALESLEFFFSQTHPEVVDLMYGNDWAGIAKERTESLRQALSKPEWVCCVCGEPEALGIVHSADSPCFHYTKQEWVGLTDEEIDKTMVGYPIDYKHEFAKAIEAKLKEKNT